ncbi:MAG: hypothetical protein COV47_00970 [Candidatus Diapherotrites archaeon CG11_big_fil_rev_8_21_14_0_20_37_9]|nr:MAG: hypothetical protein COV47_00970 [Candidatus Diapherotrites archaeon CG11_big_fil_rev_8_21_14_0_20_37_9]
MNVLEELKGENMLLVFFDDPETYNHSIPAIAKQVSGETVLYLTLNKTAKAIKEIFEKNKVKTDNFLFIDCITKSVLSARNTEDCIFVSHPTAFTEISIAISKAMKKGYNFFIMDSLTNLLVYENQNTVSKFVSSISTRVKTIDGTGIIYAMKSAEQDTIVREAKLFADKIVTFK